VIQFDSSGNLRIPLTAQVLPTYYFFEEDDARIAVRPRPWTNQQVVSVARGAARGRRKTFYSRCRITVVRDSALAIS
jgi:hypothetical protein